jgi:2-C-methyl-D-erythritol 4-phosphate cytidylyltransferase/2-C-methyl-D-erythritol 2,4-cyclodiphosphate synthase
MVCAVVVAAGKSERMGGVDKLMVELAGKPVLRRCLEAFEACDVIEHICLVTAPERLEPYGGLAGQWGITKLKDVIAGGKTRMQSVYNGLKALPKDCDFVAIQDGARPFTTEDIILRTYHSARHRDSGVAAIRCRDTVKSARGGGLVYSTLDRSALWLVQTPQTFYYKAIRRAYDRAVAAGMDATDDAAVVESAGVNVFLVEGSADNIKITTPEDIERGEAIARARNGMMRMLRVGEGFDAHRLAQGRPLILGGVEIPHEKGLHGHSDADVLIHAIMDALLGAAGLGDIGMHFPDTDDAYKGISSLALLERVAFMLRERGWRIGNIDATVAAQRPKLAHHIPAMRENIARALGISPESVNVKATTTEGMGFEGREEGISARAVAFIFLASDIF